MSLLTISNLRHTYGTHVVLDGATLSIEAGEKIGLVGRNGSGKTTLMRAIRGDLAPDSGTVQLQKGARVGYLSQHPEFEETDTVRQAAARAFERLGRLHAELEQVYE
ncbi:MAG: ATP-binding cassette domain-containing protein, partial [Planctomycetota bacterium]|nr:ATP-binding cassette domain-containing protein [Planctomycetota bacterium]